ncbi:hypothetical protein [Candidatus Poriferisodalis sp.]|uniref:hypothetical protein n=1 Tax=Candidatus Poriferisodalis sp. TaxID=3101277 RepID=UPI003B019892
MTAPATTTLRRQRWTRRVAIAAGPVFGSVVGVWLITPELIDTIGGMTVLRVVGILTIGLCILGGVWERRRREAKRLVGESDATAGV